MITEQTIATIQDLNILEVVARYGVKLDKSDKGNCPFHSEKTPSFKVYKHGVFKCFGCGAGGYGPINFVMQHSNYGFVEAIEELASAFNITIQYEKTDGQNADAKRDRYKTINELLLYSFKKFRSPDHADEVLGWIDSRKISPKTSRYFELGYSPDSASFLTQHFVAKGVAKIAEEIGLVKTKESRTYDTLRNRVTIPLHDHRGKLLGYAGRSIGSGSFAKYINPPSSDWYNKSKVLYNLHRAIPSIKANNKSVYLVEGYLDVMGLYNIGIENVVANCGTALTFDQAQLLRRYAENVTIFYDGDNAGMKATLKAIDILHRCNFRISVVNLLLEDPDDFSKRMQLEKEAAFQKAVETLQVKSKHAMEWVLEYELAPTYTYYCNNVDESVLNELKSVATIVTSDTNSVISSRVNLFPRLLDYGAAPHEGTPIKGDDLNSALVSILGLLKGFNTVVQQEYLDELKTITKLTKATLTSIMNGAEVSAMMDKEAEVDSSIKVFPEDCDRDFYLQNLFAPNNDKTGYYFMTQSGSYELIGNFVLEPLFHIKGEESKRFVKVIQGKSERVLLLDSRSFTGIDTFGTALCDEPSLVFSYATRRHFDTLKKYWAFKFPACYELEQLGWQPEGFWAFSDKVYNGQLSDYDQLGIYTHKGPKGGETKFLSPSITEKLKEHRGQANLYENDQYMAYVKSPIPLKKWMELHYKVYGEHSIYGIAFMFLTVFRDIALAVEKIPLFYCYGATASGKSSFADSLLHFFFSGTDSQGKKITPFQLSTGTEFAFYAVLGRFFNGLTVFNEFDENTLSPNRHGTIKGIFDGEGREKGTGKKNKTTVQKINQNIMLVGQFLVTIDSNSIPNRSILRSFPDKKFTEEEKENFEELRKYERIGLSSLICDVLSIRNEVENKYAVRFGQTQARLRKFETTLEGRLSARLINHYTHIYAMLDVVSEYFDLPFNVKAVYKTICTDLKKQNDLVATGNSLGEFWDVFQNHANVTKKLEEGVHYMVETTSHIKEWRNDTSDAFTTLSFEAPKRIIHIHLTDCHIAYANALPVGKSMNKDNLRKYLSEIDAFIGMTSKVQFGPKRRTSSMVFDYDLLKLELFSQASESNPNELTLSVLKDAVIKTQLDVSVMKFRAGRTDLYGQVITYSCTTRQTEHCSKLKRGAKFTAVGKMQERSFTKDNGQTITYNEFLIKEITNVIVPDQTQIELPSAEEWIDPPTDDLPF